MGILTVSGAQCMCSFGTAPSNLMATSQATCLAEGKPVATIKDMQFGVNLPPFGMCTSLANPSVAAATAAALGVLTPQPCTMVPAGPWVSSNTKVLTGGCPCLTNDATLMCGFGAGTIKIMVPGQTKVLV
ncbi:MAG: DUF4280 domain-containing protein [Lachnospiraceae bacterium]|nr:DUF4280 domain-containing protein [Lachnospiraceae bacterium]